MLIEMFYAIAAMQSMKRGRIRGIEEIKKTLIAFLILPFGFVSNSWAQSDFDVIDTARLHLMVVDNAYRLEGGRESQFTVIDARSKEEYNEAHIITAISVPEKDFKKSIYLLPKDKGVLLVVYCNGTKSATSRQWADKAKTAGYTNIVIYSEGLWVWKEKNLSIVPFR